MANAKYPPQAITIQANKQKAIFRRLKLIFHLFVPLGHNVGDGGKSLRHFTTDEGSNLLVGLYSSSVSCQMIGGRGRR